MEQRSRKPAAGAIPRSAQSISQRLGANARRLREGREWTQEHTAWRSRLAVRMYQSLEAGAANPTFATIARLCDAFEVDVQELLLPSAAPEARRPGRPRRGTVTQLPVPAPAAKNPGSILVIEAADALREALELYLERQGFDVTAAASAMEGLRRLVKEPFDLVLCSDQLPDHDSEWLLAHAPPTAPLRQTMLVIGGDPARDRDAAESALPRPLDLDRLLRVIKSTLRPVPESDAARAVVPATSVQLTLYVTKTPASRRALRNLEGVLRRYDRSRIALTVCDLEANPRAGDEADRVVFTPTLVKRGPTGTSWLLGDLQDRSAVESLLQDSGLERVR